MRAQGIVGQTVAKIGGVRDTRARNIMAAAAIPDCIRNERHEVFIAIPLPVAYRTRLYVPNSDLSH